MKVISRYIVTNHDAGPKAKVDIENLLKKEYNAEIITYKIKSHRNNIMDKMKKFIFCKRYLNTKDLVVIQFPFINSIKALSKAENKIGIVHDVEGIRYNDKEILNREITTLNSFKVLIVHNEKMKNYLIENGLTTKCVVLEFFDYLNDNANEAKKEFNKDNIQIAYPGNWSKNKAKFLYDLDENKMNFRINVYGPNTENDKLSNKKVEYKGSYSPDMIVNKIEGDFGLVWSGDVDENDGNQGEKFYNRYNTPHKLSCFIAAGMPVIVWENAAISDVVKKYNIGYTINSIYDINNLDFSNYNDIKMNVTELSKKISNGYFTKKAMNTAISYFEK